MELYYECKTEQVKSYIVKKSEVRIYYLRLRHITGPRLVRIPPAYSSSGNHILKLIDEHLHLFSVQQVDACFMVADNKLPSFPRALS